MPDSAGRRFGGEAIDARFDAVDARVATLTTQIDNARNEVVAALRGELNQAVVTRSRLKIVSLFTALAALGGFVLALARLVV